HSHRPHHLLHPFPTRRSSDLSIQPDMWPLDANSRRPGGKISLKLPQTLKQPLTDSGYHLLRNLTRRLRSQRRSHTSLSSYLAASPLRYDSERSLAFPPKQIGIASSRLRLPYLTCHQSCM